jgi:DNA-binding NtrC family response regulator
MGTILIVDDNVAVCTALEVLFSLHGLKTRSAHAPAEALALVEAEAFDVAIQDMNFGSDKTSGADGVRLFQDLREREPDLPIILLTAWTHLETAVDLVKRGAADYMAKPWDDQRLVTTVMNLLKLGRLSREQRRLATSRRVARNRLADRFDLCGMVYQSEAMQELVSLAARVAKADVPVLITGPNGAGKEKVAEIIQANSAVRAGPFVKVNVGALPGELVSAELFGAEPGAYTGAGAKARPGRFETADGGTLLLDEIGTLSLDGQVKLLRVLQTGTFERLGSTQSRSAKVRLLTATNTDLRAAIKAGTFREDLYYRLNVIELNVPALRARPEDILATARAFLDGAHDFSPDAEAVLLAHPWPGNVRELQNVVRRAQVLASGRLIAAKDLGLSAPDGAARAAPAAEPDREAILAALERCGGVVASAARELGLSRQAFYRRMEKFGLNTPAE